MLKTKNKVEFESRSKTLNQNIRKRSKLKKMVIGFAMMISSIAAYDVAVTATNIHHINSTINYKVENNAKLDNYNYFKEQMSTVPYSDADFKRDLLTFEYMYGYKGGDNPAFQKASNFKKDSGIMLKAMLSLNSQYANPGLVYSELNNITKNHSEKEVFDYDKYPELNQKISQVYEKDKIYKKTFDDVNMRKQMSTYFMISTDYNAQTERHVYDNLGKLLVENGFNKDIYFPDKDYLKKKNDAYKQYGYNSKEEKRVDEENIEIINTLNADIKHYYETGNYDKLRELFKIGNSFRHVVAIDPINEVGNNYNIGLPVYTILDYAINKNDPMDKVISQAQYVEKNWGSLTKEKEEYYNKGYFEILFR